MRPTIQSMLLLGLLLNASLATAQAQKELARVVEGAGFTTLNPPLIIKNTREEPNLSWRPGYLFKIVKFDQGKKGIRTVCSNLFVKDLSKPADWLTADRDGTKKGSFGLAASLLSPAGDLTRGSANVGFNWDRHTIVDFTQLTGLEVSDETLGAALKKGGVLESAISKPCADEIRRIRRPDGRFNEKIFFVTDSAISPKFKISVDRTSGVDLGLDIDFQKLVTVKPGYKNVTVSKESISHDNVDAPAFVGYRALVLDRVLISGGAVGASVVRGTITPAKPSEVELADLREAASTDIEQ